MKALEVTDEFGLHLAELTLQVFMKTFGFALGQSGQTALGQNEFFYAERRSPPSETVGFGSLETVH